MTAHAPAPAAILWDMDGTIVDTEPYWMVAEHALVGRYGGTWTHADGLSLVGNSLDVSASVVKSRGGVPHSIEEIIELLTDDVIVQLDDEMPWRPGARELLAAQQLAGIPSGLVTMSTRRMADHVGGSLGFGTVVAGDEVTRGKPDPEPYRTAAEHLGVDIRDCVVIEDSIPGVASGLAAGAAVIGVPAHVDLVPSPGLVIWPTLEGRTLADIAAVLQAVRVA